jgi:hypothetical protein
MTKIPMIPCGIPHLLRNLPRYLIRREYVRGGYTPSLLTKRPRIAPAPLLRQRKHASAGRLFAALPARRSTHWVSYEKRSEFLGIPT